MPTVFTYDNQYKFDRVVIKRSGYVVGIDNGADGTHKHHYPPQRVYEVEGDAAHER